MNKKLLATGGIVSSLFMMGSSMTYAASNTTTEHSRAHTMSTEWMTTVASKLGLDIEQVKTELAAGKTLKDIFSEHNITDASVKAVLGDMTPPRGLGMKGMHRGLREIPTEMLQVQANVLGVTVDQLKTEMQTAHTPMELAKAHNISAADFHTKMIAEVQKIIDSGTLSSDQLTKYQEILTHLKSDKPGAFKGHQMKKGMDRGPAQPEMLQLQANVLGITTDQLKTELAEKHSFMKVVEAHGLTRADLKMKMKDGIQKLIDSGTLSSGKVAFYQKLLEHMNSAKAQ